jgi:hypothetical protein
MTAACFFAGVCLWALAIWLYPWRWRGVNAAPAGAELATADVRDLAVGSRHLIPLRIPDSKEWLALERAWGVPEFVVALTSTAGQRRLACLSKNHIAVRIMDAKGRELPTKPAYPYAYSSICSGPPGLSFVANSGSEVTIRIERLATPGSDESRLIVVPNWENEKDKLVGTALQPTMQKLSIIVGRVGMLCVLAGGLLRRDRISAGK